MDLRKQLNKCSEFIKKYKYVAIVLLVGLILMMFPTGKKSENNTAKKDAVLIPEETFEEQLSKILQQISGVGSAMVLLTEASGKQTIYQSNSNTSTSNDTTSNQTTTVIVTDSERAQSGLIQQINPPKYLGAIVICQGADSPAVRLAVIDAVSKITGLGSDRISVLKMK